MKKLYIIIMAVFISCYSTNAQKLELEKTYEITGKSKRGYLGKVEYDAAAKVYSLIYVTKSTERKVKFETYRFDKDFNFLDKKADELDVDRAKLSFSWFNFRGDSYVIETISVSGNFTGTLVLKKKRITYYYDWFFGGYNKKVELLEKIKPKNDEGNQYFYHTHVEDEVTGDILIVAGLKEKGNPGKSQKEFVLLKFNKDFDKVKETNLKFDFLQNLAVTRSIPKVYEGDDENIGIGGLMLIFAPMGGSGMKDANPNKNAYTYVKVNENGEIIDRVGFDSPATYWKIDEIVAVGGENTVYVFGPAAEGKDKYYNASTSITKFKAIQLLKIKDGKMVFITSANLDEIESKIKTPPNQKKAPSYEGKKFDIKGYKLGSSDDFFIYGQNFDQGDKGLKYRDVIGFQFDSKGVLKSQYGVDTKETNATALANGAPQFLQEGSNRKDMYWILTEIDGVKETDAKSDHATIRLLLYPRVAKIDQAAGTVGDFVTLGKVDKKTFYLDNRFPYLPVDEGNSLVFFGNDKSGKVLWFGKLKLD
jgi:hypothetical protein